LFQWFLDLELDEEPFDASSFSKNQQRLLEHQVADEFFAEVVGLLRERNLLSQEHFSVDGTLIEAWASLKSFRPKDEGDHGPKDGNGWGDFSGQKRSNETHESTTDPEAKLLKKGPGKEAKLCFTGHAVMENRHGFCVNFELTPSVGVTESEMALEQLKQLETQGVQPDECRGRQRLPQRAVCGGLQGPRHQSPCGHRQGPQSAGLGWAPDPQQGLSDESDHSQTRRANLWVDEEGGRPAPQSLPGRRAYRRGVQMGGGGPEPVALGQTERGGAERCRAGVSPR
jgi:hypothetical protein